MRKRERVTRDEENLFASQFLAVTGVSNVAPAAH